MSIETPIEAPPLAEAIPARAKRISGLDSIRFICALTVMLFHVGLINGRLQGDGYVGIEKLSVGVFNCLFNGPAAVIVFFIISGFCIHYPYRLRLNVPVLPFYARRLVRISLPAMVFVTVWRITTKDRGSIQETVLWSVVCEVIYYAIYPLLLALRRAIGWESLTAVAAIAAIVLIATRWSWLSFGLRGYVAFGWATWVIGLPCWLLGCWLAEAHAAFRAPTRGQIWIIRFGMFCLTVFLGLVRFHVNSNWSSNCILLDLFSAPAALWLGCEIAYSQRQAPPAILEWAGKWSYSLYLVHPLVGPLLAAVGLTMFDKGNWMHACLLFVVLLVSYAFYLCIELPAHRLAILTSRRASKTGPHQLAPSVNVAPSVS